MKQLSIFFEQILGIEEPWYIKKIVQDGDKVKITIDFKNGSRFLYNDKKYEIHDVVERKWQHMNLCQHKAYIVIQVPRIKTPEGLKIVDVPWMSSDNGFVLV